MGHNNSFVKQLVIRNLNLSFVPKNVARFFPNIESLDFYESRIQEIRRSDIEGFPWLKQLRMDRNHIKVLESNLFDANLMNAITFLRNPIVHVGYDVFESLKDLKTLHFDVSTC